jgi:hypothetical protein
MRGKRIIEATVPPAYIGHLLGADDELPLFKLSTTCYLEDETPIEHSIGYHRSDRSHFEVELIRHASSEEGQNTITSIEAGTLPQSFSSGR